MGGATPANDGLGSDGSYLSQSRSPWPGGGELLKMDYDAVDPFIRLTSTAIATTTVSILDERPN